MRSTPLLTAACLLALAAPLTAQSGSATAARRAAELRADSVRRGVARAQADEAARLMVQVHPAMSDSLRSQVMASLRTAPSRGTIGVTISLAPGEQDSRGAVIEGITPRGPADRAGLRAGDVITSVNGVAVLGTTPAARATNQRSVAGTLINTLSRLQPGKSAAISVLRDGKTLVMHVTPDLDTERSLTAFQFEDAMAEAISFEDAMAKTISARRFEDARHIPWITQRYRADSTRTLMGSLFEDALLQARNDSSTRIWRQGTTALVLRDSARREQLLSRGALQEQVLAARSGATVARRQAEVFALAPEAVHALSRLELAAVNPELGAYFGVREGVLVLAIAEPGVVVLRSVGTNAATAQRQQTGTAAATAGTKYRSDSTNVLQLQPGDVVTAVDGRSVSSPTQLLRILRSYQSGESITLSVHRQQKGISVKAQMPD